MKKLITIIFGIVLVYSCSTSTDSNGNTNTTVVPLPPSNLSGTVASTTQINLSWTDNSTNETGFKIERRTGTGIYAIVGTVNSNILTFSDSGLLQNTIYIYRVYSYNTVGNSLTYSNEINITTNSIGCPDVTIGNQIWSSCNLDVTTYNDGTPIPQVTDPSVWAALTTGAWCYYNNDSANGTTYGKLYNWYAVAGIHDTDLNTPNKILAPTGWHMPKDAEWTTLSTYLGGVSVAGGKMKSTGTSLWASPNTAANNESGFTGLPGGYRREIGTFESLGKSCNCWNSSDSGDLSMPNSWNSYLYYTMGSLLRYSADIDKTYGFSVRCLRD
jgi:uncharacterized protein (TIGR02145 family)